MLAFVGPARADGDDPVAACAAALDGSAVQAAAGRLGVPVLCESRPAGAPPVAGGEYGDGVVHLWPVGLDPRLVRKLLGHELGHVWSGRRADLTAAWSGLRGSGGTSGQEDFAESFYLANFREPGLSWVTYGGLPVVTDDQLEVMRNWWAPRPTVAPEPERPVPPPVEAPVAVDAPAPPPAVPPRASAPPAAPVLDVAAAPSVVVPAVPVGARAVPIMLSALREAGA